MEPPKPTSPEESVALRGVIRGTGGILFLGFGYLFLQQAWWVITMHGSEPFEAGWEIVFRDVLLAFFLILFGALAKISFDMLCQANFHAVSAFISSVSSHDGGPLPGAGVGMILLQPCFPDSPLLSTSPHGLRSGWAFLLSMLAFRPLHQRHLKVL